MSRLDFWVNSGMLSSLEFNKTNITILKPRLRWPKRRCSALFQAGRAANALNTEDDITIFVSAENTVDI